MLPINEITFVLVKAQMGEKQEMLNHLPNPFNGVLLSIVYWCVHHRHSFDQNVFFLRNERED